MKNIKNMWKKIAIVVGLLVIAVAVLMISPNFKKDPNEGKINFIINNKNVTSSLKKDIFIDSNGVIYASKEDIANFFDGQIYYDKENEQVTTTSDTKVAVLSLKDKTMKVNGAERKLLGTIVRKDGTLYIPISELNGVYNVEVTNINNSVITIDSLDRELVKADASKKISVKSTKKFIAKTVDKVEAGAKVIIISEKDGWARVRTTNGKIGYVKSDKLTNKTTVRLSLIHI